MNPRERWQSLQSHLSAARGALAGGDRTLALEHIEAALLIDPEFLAARMLRDRVTSPEPEAAARAPLAAPQRVQAVTPLVGVPSDALASLEERVMQRVRERTQTAARSPVSKRQPWRVGVQLAAAAVFLTAVSSTAVYEPRILTSRSFATSARLVDVEAPAPIGFRDVPEQPSPSQTEPPLVRPASNAVALAAMIDAPPEPGTGSRRRRHLNRSWWPRSNRRHRRRSLSRPRRVRCRCCRRRPPSCLRCSSRPSTIQPRGSNATALPPRVQPARRAVGASGLSSRQRQRPRPCLRESRISIAVV